MSVAVFGGLLAGELEARIPPGDFPVEMFPRLLAAVDREQRAEFAQSGFDLFLGTAGAVAGALARGSLAVQPVGLLAQARSPLEECCMVLGMGLNSGPRVRGRRGFQLPAAQQTKDPLERPAHRRTQEA